MKINEILSEAQHKAPEKKKQSMAELIERLKKAGGAVYSEITHGTEIGWLGYNGKGSKKVYFAFYPDGDMQRFEAPVQKGDLKVGWTAKQYTDPETVLKDKVRAEKLRKAEEKEAKFEQSVHLSDAELEKLCNKNGIHFGGDIADSWIYEDDVRKIGGRWVAWTVYSITIKNEDYENNPELHDPNGTGQGQYHDPYYVAFYRDAKDPDKIHVRDDIDLNL